MVPPADRQPKAHFNFQTGTPLVPVELEALGYNPEQEPVFRSGGYEGYHWLQTESGEGEVTIGPRRTVLAPRQGLLLPPGLPHSYIATSWPWSTRYLTFRGPMAEVLVSSVGQPTSAVFTWDHRVSLETLLATQTEGLRAGEWGTVWSRSALVYQFLTQLRDHGRPLGPPVGTIADLDERMGPLFEYVEEHLADPDLGVDSMAGFLGVSPRQLTDLFGKVGPLSPYQYLKDRRMNRARQLLLGSRELGVKEISFRVGFRDPSHFIQTFRHTVGKSPDQFRRALVPTG